MLYIHKYDDKYDDKYFISGVWSNRCVVVFMNGLCIDFHSLCSVFAVSNKTFQVIKIKCVTFLFQKHVAWSEV